MSVWIEHVESKDDYLIVTIRVFTACCKKTMKALCKPGEVPIDIETFQEFNGYTKQLIEKAIDAHTTTSTKK